MATTLAPTLLLPAALASASSTLLTAREESGKAWFPERVNVLSNPDDVGANGRLPHDEHLSPELLDMADRPQELATGAGPLVDVPNGPLGIPEPMLAAYVKAADRLSASNPGCGVHWSVLASIGRIESGHARSGRIDVRGTTVSAILGPRLTGSPGVAAIPDTDGGRLDGDPVWDRAVGSMQFIPSTWRRYAVDGNRDGVATPHNVHDATVAAGRYLCSGPSDLRDPRSLAAAVFRYNHSESYVRTVLVWAAAYARGVTPTRAELAPHVDENDVLAGHREPDGPAVVAMPPPSSGSQQAPPPSSAPPSSAPPSSSTTPPSSEPRPSEPPSPPPGSPTDSLPPIASSIRPPSVAPPSVVPPSVAPPSVPPPSVVPPSGTKPPEPSAPPSTGEPPAPPSTQPPTTQPPTTQPPTTQPPSTQPPPSSTPPSTPQPTTTQPPSTQPPSTEPPEPVTCKPSVLSAGEFVTEEQAPTAGTVLEPGATAPSAAIPGELVYVEVPAAGPLQPCVVPPGFQPPGNPTPPR